jgi:hypothetical protein
VAADSGCAAVDFFNTVGPERLHSAFSGSDFHMRLSQKLKSFFRGQSCCGVPNGTQLPSQFQSDADVERYVEVQLAKGLPSGWRCQRIRNELQWRIEPKVRTDKIAADADYILRVSGDRRFFIFYYGNTDAGALVRFLSRAMVLSSVELCHYPLAEAIRYVIQNCELNYWGLT